MNNYNDLLKWLHGIILSNREEKKKLGFIKCARCYEYKNIKYSVPLCDACAEFLKENFPEIYEEARLENIKLYDEKYK